MRYCIPAFFALLLGLSFSRAPFEAISFDAHGWRWLWEFNQLIRIEVSTWVAQMVVPCALFLGSCFYFRGSRESN